MNEIVFSKEAFYKIQKLLGKRPGDYRLDPYYLRHGIADKPYFWNVETKKWEMVRLGDIFHINEDGSVDRIPVEKGKYAS